MANPGTYAKGAARREEMLQAAFDALAERGHRKTSLRDIAGSLDVTPAHLLYYFDSREELLQEVVQRWDAEALAQWDGSLDLFLDLYVETIRHNQLIPGVVRLYLTFASEAGEPSHSSHSFFRDRFQRLRTAVADAIRWEVSQGRFNAVVDPDAAASTFIALSDGLQLQAMVDESVDPAAALEEHLRLLRSAHPPRTEG